VGPVKEDVVLRVRGRRLRIDALDHERCDACGERIFGIEASRQIDAAVLPRRGKHVA
jgi:YgiT-type zinc finger domain-containing protein